MHYTYCHTKNTDGKVFYIGKGTKRRAFSKEHRNKYWQNTVNLYGMSVEILAYWDTHEEALEHEKLLISCFKEMGYTLTNLTDGGEGTTGVLFSQERLKKMSEANKGKKHSEETKKKISLGGKGRVVSEETKLKMSAWQKGKPKTEEAKANMRKPKTKRNKEHNG